MYAALRRTAIFMAGSTVVTVGMVFWLLPGPGWLIVFIGLLILATEFAFARHLLERVRHLANQGAKAMRLPLHWRQRLHLEPRGAADSRAGAPLRRRQPEG